MFNRKKDEFTFNERKLKKVAKATEEETVQQGAVTTVTLDTENEYTENAPTVEISELKGKKEPRKKVKTPKQKAYRLPFYKNKKAIGRLLMGVSLAIVLIVNPAVSYMTSQELSSVVVATVDIKEGALITSDMVTVTNVKKESVLPIQILSDSQVVGQYAKSSMVSGEIISIPKLTAEIPKDNAFLYALPKEKKAISISVDALSTSVSSMIEAGDIVSVFVPIRDDDKDVRKYSTLPPELQYVEVLACTNSDGYAITDIPEKSTMNNPLVNTVTLAVDDRQAVILAGNDSGRLHLALAFRGERESAQKLLSEQQTINQFLDTQDALLAQQGGEQIGQ